MSKKIIEVEGIGKREVPEINRGSFYSAHKQEDIERWLQHNRVGEEMEEYDQVFTPPLSDSWEHNFDYDPDVVSGDIHLSNFELEFTESEDADGVCLCRFDDAIQEFLDEESIKNKEKNK